MEIKKYVYVDPRVVSMDSSFPIIKGASNQVTHQIPAASVNSNNHKFEFQSEGVDMFNSLDVKQNMDFIIGFKVHILAAGLSADDPICPAFALATNPISSIQKTATVVINTTALPSQTLENIHSELLRLQPAKNSIFQTYPSNLDNQANYGGVALATANILSGYENSVPDVYSGNGSYPYVFCDVNGNTLTTNTIYAPAAGGLPYMVNARGVPICASTLNAGAPVVMAANGDCYLYIRVFSEEPTMAEPFAHGFNPSKDTRSINGVNKFSIGFDLMADKSRLLRVSNTNPATHQGMTNVTLTSVISTNLVITSLSKNGSDLGLFNPRCIVPYMRYEVAPTIFSQAINVGTTAVLTSSSYTFQELPSYFLIFAKPAQYTDNSVGDFHYEITNLSVSGCHGLGSQLYTMTQAQLYEMSVSNGLAMDYYNWLGRAMTANGLIQTSGPILLVRPCINFSYGQMDLTGGVDENVNIQFKATIRNNTSANITAGTSINFYTVPIYMEKLILENGKLIVIKSPVTQVDVMDVSIEKSNDNGNELLLGGGWFDSLKNIFSKVKNIYEKTKPYVSAVKNALPEGAVRDTMSKVGYGKLTGGAIDKYL